MSVCLCLCINVIPMLVIKSLTFICVHSINNDTKIHILCFPFSIWTNDIHLSRKTVYVKRHTAWGRERYFYPWGLKHGSGWAIFARVRKLQLNGQWYGKRRIYAMANWRHKANESARVILPMTSIARDLQCVRRARRARVQRYYFHWQGAAWIENRILIPHDSDETLTRRSVGTIRTLGTLRRDSKGLELA